MSNVEPDYLNKNGTALVLFEAILVAISMMLMLEFAGYLVKYYDESFATTDNSISVALTFVIIAQLLSLSLGLYSKNLRENFRGVCQRLFLSYLLATFLTILFFDISMENSIAKVPIIGATIITFFILCYLRYQLLNLAVCHSIKKRILVLGAGKRAAAIENRTRREADRRQFSIHAYVRVSGDATDMIRRDLVIDQIESLEQYVIQHNIEQIVIALDDRRNNLSFAQLSKCKFNGVSVVDVLTFVENETGQIAIDLLYPDWIVYSAKFSGSDKLTSLCKWLFDCIIAVAISLIAIPFVLIAIIAIKLEDGLTAPVFYFQTRIGRGGKSFDIIKLRSMSIDAEQNGAVWAQKNDSRVTRVGRVIRKYRVDELPQLFNVLNGDMSFVGPRPERPEFVNQLSLKIPFYNERHHVKPGLTGWAQIQYPYGASQKDAFEKLKFDFYYIKNRSYLFDLFILLRTTETILFNRGAR